MSELIRSIKGALLVIDNLNNQVTEKKFIEKLSLMLNIIVWDMQINKDDEYLKKRLFVYTTDFLKLLLLKLRLFIKYEDKLLYLSSDSFRVLKLYLVSFLNELPNEDYENPRFVETARIMFNVTSRIYQLDDMESEAVGVEFIKKSLLSQLYDSFILYTQNFWKVYFAVEYKKSKERTIRQKTMSVVESMVFYSYFLSKDITFTVNFVKKCIPEKTLNFELITKTVSDMMNEHVLGSKHCRNSDIEIEEEKSSGTKKLISVLVLTMKLGYVGKTEPNKLYTINKETSKGVLVGLITHILHNNGLSDDKREFFWLKLIDLKSDNSHYKKAEKPRELSEDERHQIKIDVKRTNGWLDKDYHERLEYLITNFIAYSSDKIEYYQGLNFIIAYLMSIFKEDKDIERALAFIYEILIKDFLSHTMHEKLSVLSYQLTRLLAYYYPSLMVKWQNFEVNIETLFSSFFLTLLTSTTQKKDKFILQFWDILLTEEWNGMLKCLVYCISINYDNLIAYDFNETLRFFTEFKNKNILYSNMKETDFKVFIKNLIFDEAWLKNLERHYRMISKKNVFKGFN